MSRSGWTTHPEAIPSCDPLSTAVGSEEEVARLLHSNIFDPAESRFTTSELFRGGSSYSNDCGESDGVSVDRSGELDEDALAKRTAILAGDNRQPKPPLFGLVGDIRAILVPNSKDQAFFVYDDPIDEVNLEHAVIRGSEAITGRGKRRALRDRLLDVFKFSRASSS